MANDIYSLVALFGNLLLGIVIFLIVMHIYVGFALYTIAKKTKTKNGWMAFIPFANFVLMANMVKMHWWPVLLLIGALIPFLGWGFSIAFMVFFYIWMWKICEIRKKPGWWVLLQLIPIFGFVWTFIVWGILAWSDKN